MRESYYVLTDCLDSCTDPLSNFVTILCTEDPVSAIHACLEAHDQHHVAWISVGRPDYPPRVNVEDGFGGDSENGRLPI